jgi:hypothetical protein
MTAARSAAGAVSHGNVCRPQVSIVQACQHRLVRRVPHRAFERLERHAWKHARAVLRGGGGGNTISLPDLRLS